MDHNGNAVNLVLIALGEIRADSRHTISALERQNEILLDLPSQLSTVIASKATPSRLLPELTKLLKAVLLLATAIGLVTGQTTWTDVAEFVRP